MSRRTPLMLQIATGDPRPINRQITDGIKRLIAAGELPVGAALPSVRGLATQLFREDELVEAAVAHAIAAHSHTDTPQFRALLRTLMKDGTPPFEAPAVAEAES